jgi:hypothetical protein
MMQARRTDRTLEADESGFSLAGVDRSRGLTVAHYIAVAIAVVAGAARAEDEEVFKVQLLVTADISGELSSICQLSPTIASSACSLPNKLCSSANGWRSAACCYYAHTP